MQENNFEIKTENEVASAEQDITMADIEVIDSNLSLWEKIKTGQIGIDRNITETKIKMAYISILPTVLFLIMVLCDSKIQMSEFGHNAVAVVAILFLLAAFVLNLLSAPLRLITTPLRWAGKGAVWGIIVPLIGNLFGLFMGFVLGIYVAVFFPAAITIPFLRKKR